MNLKHRLKKLESAMPSDDNKFTRIVYFIVNPEGLETMGYICKGVQISCEPGESIEKL